MIVWLFRQFLYLHKAFEGQDTARQLAYGCALGMLLGLLPKGNLLAVAVSLVILGTRTNLGTAMVCALVFSLIGVNLDSLTHPLGETILGYQPLAGFWTLLYGIPLVPWTSFNNTVVMGSLVLGLILFYPTYRVSYSICGRWRRAAADPEEESDQENQEKRSTQADSKIVEQVLETPTVATITPESVAPVAFVRSTVETAGPAMSPPACSDIFGSWQRIDQTSSTHTAPRLPVTTPVYWERTDTPALFG